jgi:hypothetical protein
MAHDDDTACGRGPGGPVSWPVNWFGDDVHAQGL